MNSRQEKILSTIIEEYTKTAIPVGSQILASKYSFKVSTATLRNDMMALEKEGFLHQPHISAGRIPTDKGYRYFVEEIMKDKELSKEEQQKIANCLSSVDDLITAQTNRLEALRNHKKGLMQQLFPNIDEC